MSKFWGVRYSEMLESLFGLSGISHDNRVAQLKQQALLFDKIGICDLDDVLEDPKSVFSRFGFQNARWDNELAWRNELEWLAEKQVIFPISTQIKPELTLIKDELNNYISNLLVLKEKGELEISLGTTETASFLVQQVEKTDKIKKDVVKMEKEIKKLSTNLDEKKISISEFEQQANKFLNTVQLKINFQQNVLDEARESVSKLIDTNRYKQAIILRLIALQAELLDKVTAVPLFSNNCYLTEFPTTIKNNVVEIVINNLPLPSGETPWEEILDYRNDPEAQGSLLSLRRWIRKIAAEQLPVYEIEEELEYLKHEFNQHMRLHKLKANTETLETIVKAPLEILEDIVKLKFSKIPEPFFAIKKRQISLLEAEINAPGKEVAYLVKTKEKFTDNA